MAENDVRAAGTPQMPDANQLAQAMEQALDEMTEDTYDQAVLNDIKSLIQLKMQL